MSTLLLSALSGSGWEGGVAFSANHFIAFVFPCKGSQGGLDLDGSSATSSKSEDEMEGRFLLDVVVGKGPAIFQLFSSENKSLLVWGNSFLILNLGPVHKRVIKNSI